MTTGIRRNHYTTLEVSQDASSDKIRKAYKALALKFHPDKHHNEPYYVEKFKEIAAAYEIIGDETNRAEYDLQFRDKIKSDAFNAGAKKSESYTPQSYTPHYYDWSKNISRYDKSDIISVVILPKTTKKSFELSADSKFINFNRKVIEYISAKDLGIEDYSDLEEIEDSKEKGRKFIGMAVDKNEFSGCRIYSSRLHSIYKGLSIYYIVNLPYINSIRKTTHLKGGGGISCETIEKKGNIEVILDEKNFKIYKEQILNDNT